MLSTRHSVVSDSATLWTVASQAPLSMGFSGKNTGEGSHFLLLGILPTQESNSHLLCLLHGVQTLYTLSHWGSSSVFTEHLLKWPLPLPSFVVRCWYSHSWLFIACEASLGLDSSPASPTVEVPASVCS